MSTRFHVAVRRADDDAVLVERDGALPGFTKPDAPPWPVVSPVVEAMAALGLEVVALRTAWVDDARLTPGAATHRLTEVAWVGGAVPAGSHWIPLEALERRPTPLGRAIDAGALEPAVGMHQPWYRPGWWEDMGSWIDERLAEIGRRRIGPVSQVRSWGRSALLSLETDGGTLWAKAVPAVFSHEVAVTALLADVDPGIVPPLVAGDAVAGRLLMEHVDGPLLSAIDAPDAWAAALARLAELQRVLAADLRALEVAGVPSASLGTLEDRLQRLVAADPAWAPLEPMLDGLLSDARALTSSAVNRSLEHGDLSARQVIMGAMGPVFLDWSDATIAHPFLAAASFLASVPTRGPGVERDADGVLSRAYLAAWGADDPVGLGDLGRARRIHPVHAALQCRDRTLPGLDQPWELDWLVPDLLASVATAESTTS